MNNQDNKAEVSVPFNQSQSAYLQRLGLTTLLERKFPKSLSRLVKTFWHNRMTVGLFGLVSYSLFATFVLASLYHENIEQDAKLELAMQNHSDHIAMVNKDSQKAKLEELMSSIQSDDINVHMGKHGATIMHKIYKPETDVKYINYLIRKGANLNIKRVGGDQGTPLMCGVYRGAYSQVLFTLKKYPHLIDLNVKNANGKTLTQIVVMRWVESEGHPDQEHLKLLHDHLTLVHN